MTYKYDGKNYEIEWARLGNNQIEIWLQNPDDLDDYHYIETLPEKIHYDIEALVFSELDVSLEEDTFVGYID